MAFSPAVETKKPKRACTAAWANLRWNRLPQEQGRTLLQLHSRAALDGFHVVRTGGKWNGDASTVSAEDAIRCVLAAPGSP